LSFKPIDQDFAIFEIGGIAYKPFPRGAWDLEQRSRTLASAEVDMHVLQVPAPRGNGL